MLAAGKSLYEIFDGPLLEHGFLLDETLENTPKREAVNVSDLIHAIMDVAGVRAVSAIRFGESVTAEPWSIEIGANQVAKLGRYDIKLTREGKTIRTPGATFSSSSARSTSPRQGVNRMARPAGRNRNIANYTSVQKHMPAIYGVGDAKLTSLATPTRKAHAKQLEAYLMFFDQLMGDYLAQLAHAKDLFSYDNQNIATYFSQTLGAPAPTLTNPAPVQPAQNTAAAETERKGRFLNHLLARFADALDEREHGGSPEAFNNAKMKLLRQYPEMSGARGTGFNYRSDAPSQTALEKRIRLELGLNTQEFVVLEHLLLLPVVDKRGKTINAPTALLSAADPIDPYSFQVTFAFPLDEPFTDENFRKLVELTIRNLMPAHLTAYVRWIEPTKWNTFRTEYESWLGILRKANAISRYLEPAVQKETS